MKGESAFAFSCNDAGLPAIVHPVPGATRGVLVIVGGPQYRAGSHRQFVLLARELAAQGIPVMRFDYRGMGDAEGDCSGFTGVNEDVEAAIEAFLSRQPDVRQVVLWGLCDAASAALFYGWRDPRVAGMVLLNPWVRTESGQARTYLRHYYLQRLVDRDFWRKLLAGRLDWIASLRSLGGQVKRVRSGKAGYRSRPDDDFEAMPLPERMAEGLARFDGRVLFILSGQDLTADEFRDTVAASSRWKKLMQKPAVSREDLAEADHTFSRREWRDEVARRTLRWVESI